MNAKRLAGLITPLIFLIAMSWYNYLVVHSYNYTIFDLGLSYRLMYLFAYDHTIIFYGHDIIFSPYPFGKYIFVPLSFALYLYNSITTPLLLQIIVIASGGYAVFRIAHLKTGNFIISIMIQFAYFLYPATYGFMAHGGNFQVLIEGFILIGYMFYIQKKEVFAYLAFAMASLTNIWAPIIVFAFILVDLMTQYDLFYFRSIKGTIKNFNYKLIFSSRINRKFALFLIFFIFDAVIFLQTFHFAGGINNLISSSRVSIGMIASPLSQQNGIFHNIFSQFDTLKLPFFFEIMSPVLFTPLLTPYFILLLLYFLISWQSSTPVYFNLLQQYPYLFASFIFIGMIHFFKKISVDRHSLRLAKKLAILVLVSSFISFCLYSPFSITNFQSGTVQKEIHISNFDRQLTYGLSLIPVNSSVFIQNDLPQLINREQVYMPGYYQNETVDYAVIVPFGFSPISNQYGGYSSYWASQFQKNKSYGIYEDIMGAIVYKLNYSYLPVYFVPYSQVILPGQNGLYGYGSIINNTLIVSNFTNIYGNNLWGGGFTSLSPGEYNFTFQVMTENTSDKNVYYQDVWASGGAIKLTRVEINGQDFRQAGEWQNFTITLYLDKFYTAVEFPAFFTNWNGTIDYKGVTIQQVGPAIKPLQSTTESFM
jgi:uncharacterized membrane protein